MHVIRNVRVTKKKLLRTHLEFVSGKMLDTLQHPEFVNHRCIKTGRLLPRVTYSLISIKKGRTTGRVSHTTAKVVDLQRARRRRWNNLKYGVLNNFLPSVEKQQNIY